MQQHKSTSDSDTAGGHKWILEQQSDGASMEAETQKRKDRARPGKMHLWREGQKLREKNNEQKDELRRR